MGFERTKHLEEAITDHMCDTLQKLQKVKTFDIERETYLAWLGEFGFHPTRDKWTAARMEGQSLACEVRYNAMHFITHGES